MARCDASQTPSLLATSRTRWCSSHRPRSASTLGTRSHRRRSFWKLSWTWCCCWVKAKVRWHWIVFFLDVSTEVFTHLWWLYYEGSSIMGRRAATPGLIQRWFASRGRRLSCAARGRPGLPRSSRLACADGQPRPSLRIRPARLRRGRAAWPAGLTKQASRWCGWSSGASQCCWSLRRADDSSASPQSRSPATKCPPAESKK